MMHDGGGGGHSREIISTYIRTGPAGVGEVVCRRKT